MTVDLLRKQINGSRRRFVGAAAALATVTAMNVEPVAAHLRPIAIKAVAFDAFAIFDPRSVSQLAEELFPGLGAELSSLWRTRQFEYTWLRNSMHQYTTFWHITLDALTYAAKQTGVELEPEMRSKLMSAYLQLKPWPDVVSALDVLKKHGLRLALLSNMTSEMMRGCVKASGLDSVFEFLLSTDLVKVFKPDPSAYQIGLDAFRLSKQELAFVAFGGWDSAGAKAFGLPTYWANRLNLPPEELGVSADRNHPDLSLLSDFIHSWKY